MNSNAIANDLKKFRVDYSIKGMKRFVTYTIPELRVYKELIPTDTKQLKLVIEDLDFYQLCHGKTTVPYEGVDIIMKNTFKIFPFSPLNGPHQYQLTVYALDKEDRIIATGSVIQRFPEQ